MAKRHLVPILLTSALVTLGGALWGINNLPTKDSIPRPERPSIVSRAQTLDYSIAKTDSTNTTAINRFQHELDSLLATQTYADSSRAYTADSTKYEAEKVVRESKDNIKIYSTLALYCLGAALTLTGLATAFVRANRD